MRLSLQPVRIGVIQWAMKKLIVKVGRCPLVLKRIYLSDVLPDLSPSRTSKFLDRVGNLDDKETKTRLGN